MTSLGYTTYLYAMLEVSTIHGHNVWFDSEYSNIKDDFVIETASGPVKFLNGTHLSASAVRTQTDGHVLLVFAQTEGNDVSVYTRDLEGGIWTSDKLPVDKE